jgi:hypothetical protein
MAVVSVGPSNKSQQCVTKFRLSRLTSGSEEQFLIKRHRFGVRRVLQAVGTAKVSVMVEEEMKRISWNWVYSTNEFVTATGAYERVSRIIG